MKPKMFFWITVVLGAWLFCSVNAVQAHEIEPKSSQPEAGQALAQAPTEVVMVFPEELVLQGSSIKVLDASGKAVDAGSGGLDLNDPQHATLRVKLNALPQGVYTVNWTIMLQDGDSTNGTYHFGVGNVRVPRDIPSDDGPDLAQSSSPAPTRAPSFPWLWVGGGLAALLVAGLMVWLLRKK
jgi:methionine-rich copper-binding protein CopC